MRIVTAITATVLLGFLVGALVGITHPPQTFVLAAEPTVSLAAAPLVFPRAQGEECPGEHLERYVCHLRVVFENNERAVESHDSNLDQECKCIINTGPGPCAGQDNCHNCPFGNWGVDSAYGSRSDTTQFRGWEDAGGLQREWNTCTGFHDAFNNGTNQQRQDPWPTDPRQWAGGWMEWEVEDDSEGCEALDGAPLSFDNIYMDLYELDWIGDDYVDWLSYPTHGLTLDCSDPDTCEGTSQWYSRNGAGNPEIDAKSRMIITGSYFETQRIEQ